ncbi:hypothetical protein D9M69_589920 [compost metagenome]
MVASATPTRVMLLAPIATRVSAPTSVMVTLAAKLAAVMPRAETSNRSWPPAGLASKSMIRSWPKPAPNWNMSLPAPPVSVSLPPPPLSTSLPTPPRSTLARPLPVTTVAFPPK